MSQPRRRSRLASVTEAVLQFNDIVRSKRSDEMQQYKDMINTGWRVRNANIPAEWGHNLGLDLTKKELQRAVPASTVLRDWRRIFSHELVDGLFEMSEPVENIETFVSHSWRTSGWKKALALSWYCAQRRIVLAAVIAPILWLLFSRALGGIVLATWYFPTTNGTILTIPLGAAPLVVPLAVALAALSVTSRSKSAHQIYLDRNCMCQYDTELMQASIHQLGAYIARSSHFLVLWDENYCSRLWCMYEVATFCSLRPLGTLHFVPVASVPPLLALWLFHTLAMIGIGYGGAATVFSPTAAFLNACGPLARVFVL